LIFLQSVYLILIAYTVSLAAQFAFSRFSNDKQGSRVGRRDSLRAAALVLAGILLLAILVLPPLSELYARAKLNDWRALARYITTNARAGDLVFGERNTPNMNALAYYLPNLLRYDTPPTTLDALRDALSQDRSIWYISVGEFFDPEGEAWARRHLEVVAPTAWMEPELSYAPSSEFAFTQSEHPATLYFRQGKLPSEIVYVGRQGFANENVDRLKMNPGERLEAELQVTRGIARVLELELASKKAARFDIQVDGQLIAQVRESEADKGTETMRWALPPGGAQIRVQIVNQSHEFPLFIKRIATEPSE
jgi:hypothetical protein